MLAPDGWLELKGGTTSNPCWTLDGGLEGDVAVVANLFDKKLGPYTSPEQSLYSTTVAQATGPCYTLAVTPATSVLAAGLIEQLTAVETDLLGNSVSATFNWSTSDPSVVTVDQTGVVTSVGGGTATITATDPKSTVSGAATVTVGCSQECYTFTFPQGIPTGETFKIYFYGTTIAGQPPVAILSGVAAGGTYTVPIETYYPTQPNEALYATVFASGPIEYQLTIPAPFVFEVNTDGVNFQVGQSFLDYTFPATGGASFVDTYVPPPVTDPSVRPQTRLR